MSELQPGRELDILIAEKIMKVPSGTTIYCPSCGYDGLWSYDYAPYSTDIASAWGIVEKLQRDKWVFRIESPYCNMIPGFWCAYFGYKYIDENAFADACNTAFSTTAPHAICLAALAAHDRNSSRS